MGRKKKLINNTNVPQYAVERFARCVFDDIRADFARPEVQAEFALWLAEREQHKKTRAAKTAALVSVMWLLHCGLFYIIFAEKHKNLKERGTL